MSPYEPPTEDGPDPDRLRDEAWDRKNLGAPSLQDQMARDAHYEEMLRVARIALRAVLLTNRPSVDTREILDDAVNALGIEIDATTRRWT